MKRLFITTTNHIDNGKAIAYHGVVSSHLVAGTGFLSDLAAGFTDIFGGRSNAYRKHMEELYDEALDEISEKAQLLGANAVLGLRIDMDNISGKGMSMFMITATGTAASVEFSSGKRVDNNGAEQGCRQRARCRTPQHPCHQSDKRILPKNSLKMKKMLFLHQIT